MVLNPVLWLFLSTVQIFLFLTKYAWKRSTLTRERGKNTEVKFTRLGEVQIEKTSDFGLENAVCGCRPGVTLSKPQSQLFATTSFLLLVTDNTYVSQVSSSAGNWWVLPVKCDWFLVYTTLFRQHLLFKKIIAKEKLITNLFEIAPQVRMGTLSDNWARG